MRAGGFPGILRRAWFRVRSHGFLTFIKSVMHALKPVTWVCYHLERKVEARPGSGPPICTDLEIIGKARRCQSLPEEFHLDTLKRYRRGFAILEAGRLLAIGWALDEHDDSRLFSLSRGDLEIGSLIVVPEHRGRGLGSALVLQACVWLQSTGPCRIYSTVAVWNTPSRRAFEAAGFEEVARVRRPILFGPKFITEHGTVESWPEALKRIFLRSAPRARRDLVAD